MKIEMGIGWVPDTEQGRIRSANPGEYAAEIERLRGLLRRYQAANYIPEDCDLFRETREALDHGN